MNAIDHIGLAEEWLEHVIRQYDMIHVCRKDLRPIACLLRAGFTLVAVRDHEKVLRVNFVGRNASNSQEWIQGPEGQTEWDIRVVS